MSKLGLTYRNKKFKQGYYRPINKNKFVGGEYAIYRSGLELKYFKFLDKSDKCIKWSSESVTVPYYWEADNKWHNYYIDLVATFLINKKPVTYLIEIKPYRQTITPVKTPRKKQKTFLTEQVMFSQNQAKWKAASAYASQKGLKFTVVTEKEIE